MAIRTKEFYKRQNEILENLMKCDLSGYDLRVSLALFRKTFLFGKYEDKISRSQISDITGILEVHVSRAEKRLKNKNIIYVNNKNKGFNLNITEWEKVPNLVPNEKVPNLVKKGTNQAEKKGTKSGTYKETTKKLPKEGGVGLEKLGIKEVEKLEGKKWLKQVMWQRGKFSIKFIDQVFSSHKFMTLYNTYLALQDAYNVRNKEAWFLARLERETEPEE